MHELHGPDSAMPKQKMLMTPLYVAETRLFVKRKIANDITLVVSRPVLALHDSQDEGQTFEAVSEADAAVCNRFWFPGALPSPP